MSNQDWFKLLPEEVLKDKNIDLEKFFVENSEYFYNLLCKLNDFSSNVFYGFSHKIALIFLCETLFKLG